MFVIKKDVTCAESDSCTVSFKLSLPVYFALSEVVNLWNADRRINVLEITGDDTAFVRLGVKYLGKNSVPIEENEM